MRFRQTCLLVFAGWLMFVACLSVLAPSVLAQSGDNSSPAAGGRPLKVHLISGAREYKSEESLKKFSQLLTDNYHVTATASWGHDGIKQLENLDALADAELLILFARRMSLNQQDMKKVQSHWEAGKPVVAIRTASHAFSRDVNPAFDRDVLGNNYQGHYGGAKCQVKNVAERADHPVLAGVEGFTSNKLYKAGELPKTTTVLQTGHLGEDSHPVSMVNEQNGRRVFYTSAGVPSDFDDENFQRLLVNAVFWTTGRDLNKMKRGK